MRKSLLPIFCLVFALFCLLNSCTGIKTNPAQIELEKQLGFPPGEKPSPDDIVALLKQGNERFSRGKSLYPHSNAQRIAMAGTESQNDYAYATIITCSDSRLPVEIIFDAGIMDIFVVRVAGNVCDTDEVGSIEYGLSHVKTPVCVILGHEQCGAVTAVTQALLGKGHKLERNIPPLVDNIIPAVRKVLHDHPDLTDDQIIPRAIEENVRQGIFDLFMESPSTRDLVNQGEVKIIGAIYDVGTGIVKWLPEEISGNILREVEQNPDRAINPYAESNEEESHE